MQVAKFNLGIFVSSKRWRKTESSYMFGCKGPADIDFKNYLPLSFCPAGEKAIVCDQCGAQFQTEESLEAHRQIHTGREALAHTHADTQMHLHDHWPRLRFICAQNPRENTNVFS